MANPKEKRKTVAKKRKSAPVGVITKVLRVLELLYEFPEGLHLKEVADKTGINKSTAHRFLNHLAQENYLMRDSSGAYFLGLRVMRLGGSRSFEKVLCKVSRPIIENLGAVTSETINLAVLEGMNVLHLDVLDSPHRFSVISEIGETGEIYCTALGKAMLAYIEDGPRKEEIFASIKFIAKTPRTIMSVGRLKEDLAQIRKQGFSHDDEEAFAGARCIGAPILGSDGHVIGAISISGPTSRISKQRLPDYARLVRQAAEDIGASISLSSTKESPASKASQVAKRPQRPGAIRHASQIGSGGISSARKKARLSL